MVSWVHSCDIGLNNLLLSRTIGVVGIDATLEEIENILLNDQWGSVYAFLVNEGGETIFHPLLRPSTEVRKSPLNPSSLTFKI